MITRFINDLKRLLNGQEVCLLDGVVSGSYTGSMDHIELTVFGESVEINNWDFGEVTTLCYSKAGLIHEMYKVIDDERALLYMGDHLFFYWEGRDWGLDYDIGLVTCCGLSTKDCHGDYLELFWYIIDNIDAEMFEIYKELCDLYGNAYLSGISHCGLRIDRCINGYRIHRDTISSNDVSIIFDGDGITVKDAAEFRLMKEMYSL